MEWAVAESIVGDFPPETFLYLVFSLPDGGCRVKYAWTAGGVELGNGVDRRALAAGLDCADQLHITDLHLVRSYRGRVRIDAYPLRPILADVLAGVRTSEEGRDRIRRFLDCAGEHSGQTPRPGVPRWMGVGPDLLNRKGA